ncbi:hypothetical protein [Hyphococcus sp.]|uniref:hypothetical protein n=1 Tax=Hyphococcus sp. TaxID=2038636 RepID=UPI003CCB9538
MKLLGIKDECWCGSKKLFRDCHKAQVSREVDEIIAVSAISNAMKRWKKCYHWDASESCKGRPIRAHTIQRQGVLRHILDENQHCLSFKGASHDESDLPELKEVGWRNASAFFGFCQHHDKIFAPIEEGNFEVTEKNLLLAAFRVVSFELHQKESSLSAIEQFKAKNPSINNDLQFHAMLKVHQEGLENALKYAQMISSELKGGKSLLRHAVIEVAGTAEFLAAGTPSPGKLGGPPRIAPIGSPLPPDGFLFTSVHEQKNGYIWCFSYPPDDKIASDFVNFVVDKETKLDESILPHILSQYCEHTFFSWSWWSALNYNQRTFLRMVTADLFEEFDPHKLQPMPSQRTAIKAYHL